MVGKHQAEADRELRQAKIINDLLELLAKNFTGISKEAMHLTEVFKKVNEKTTQVRLAYESREKHDNKIAKGQDKDREFMEWKIKYQDRSKRLEELSLKNRQIEDGKQKDARARNRIETERVHGENVRHNLKMRQLYKDQSETYAKVMNMMTGGLTGKGAAMGGVKTAYNTISLGSGILDISGKLRLAKSELEDYEISEADEGTSPQMREMIKMFRAKVTRLAAVQEEMRNKLGMFEGLFGGEGDNDSKWAKRLEFLSEWAKKHKNGIIISAVSIGMMFMVFKKLLSVSPMLQKMLEVMGLAFNLILRPFGDFIGFILRPIAMGFLMMVMPFFKKAYPMMMELGSTIGEALANWDFGAAMTAVLDAFPPFEMIAAIAAKLGIGSVSDENNDKADVVLAAGAILGAGGLGIAGSYGLMRTTRWGIGKIFGGSQKAAAGAFSGLEGGGNPSDGVNKEKMKGKGWNEYDPDAPKAKPNRFTNITKHLSKLAGAKVAILAASKAMLAFKLSNPIGWALLGWEGVTSAIKHFDPDLYQQMRDSTEFMGMGREFIGLGENSLAEHGVAANTWLQHQLYGENVGLNEDGSNPETNVEMGNTIHPDYGLSNPMMPNYPNQKTIQITFNIDKVEKGVDVNMIALQVKSILETNDRYVTN